MERIDVEKVERGGEGAGGRMEMRRPEEGGGTMEMEIDSALLSPTVSTDKDIFSRYVRASAVGFNSINTESPPCFSWIAPAFGSEVAPG